MWIKEQEINSIEEAFALLTPEEQAHGKRVAAYSDIAFAKIIDMDLYLNVPKAERELDKKQAPFVHDGALYHDIGKLLPDEEPLTDDAARDDYAKMMAQDSPGELVPYLPKEHTIHGKEIITALYPNFGKMLVRDKTMILDGVGDHHERINGTGTPYGLKEERISYTGRIVAIADILDHISMTVTSEDPIGESLRRMKPLVKSGQIDENFFKAFCSNGAKLRKVFRRESCEASEALPEADPWIRRKAARPLQLFYQKGSYQDREFYLARPRFKNGIKNDLSYEDIKQLLKKNKLTPKLPEYFFYEALDALKRFRGLGMEAEGVALLFPADFYQQKGFVEALKNALQDQAIDPEDLLLAMQEEEKGVSPKVQETLDALEKEGFRVLEESELECQFVTEQEELREEDDFVKERIDRIRMDRGEMRGIQQEQLDGEEQGEN